MNTTYHILFTAPYYSKFSVTSPLLHMLSTNQVEVFSIVTLCSVVVGHQHFRGHLRDEVCGKGKKRRTCVCVRMTVWHMEKVLALLDDPAYKNIVKDPSHSTEWKTTLLSKVYSLSEDLIKWLWPHGSQPHRLYDFPSLEAYHKHHWCSYTQSSKISGSTGTTSG